MSHHDTIAELNAAVGVAGERWVALAKELGAVADELARLDGELSVALNRAGAPRLGPSARQLAADVLFAACRPLHPWTPYATQAGGQIAAERLTSPQETA